MITIFVLLGLGFCAGGIAAIVDGWPYLLLERGFTQVIVGSVAVTAGVILLALSWVLVELRRVRVAIAGALTLPSAGPSAAEAARASVEMGGDVRAIPGEARSTLPGLGTVAAGAGLVAAGGALAASMRGGAEHAAAATQDLPEPVISDLFDEITPPSALPAERREEAVDAVEEPEEVRADIPAAETHEPHEAEAVLPELAPEIVTPSIAVSFVTQHGDEAAGEGEGADTSAVVDDKELRSPSAQAPAWWPQVERPRPDEVEPPVEADDFGALRQHLSFGPQRPGAHFEPEPEPDLPVGETSFDQRDREIDEAAAWMAPAFGRREPPFGEPEQVADEPTIPRWPPLTSGTPRLEPDVESADMPEAEPDMAEAETRIEPVFEESEAASEPLDEAEEATSGEETETVPESPRPATSDEGVVGAYQVGDTHFTMYADGSIQARTPDGEYKFASMDELKTYLASEKSRLGG
ncbi:hypothetical protein [Bosea sp. BIWAKO-01]|uniref:hypothetical protein n=1 Tax=Bosea sp. BIWAKO-01 TaxID=506668 RepID=UPI00086AE9E2|nr:hypothetical protein [Bosea sp. BIWAKO-01]GAU80932.1 Fe-S oxidoreductase [Bosea sp. BIWAKO-01]